jgi:hypothetical protein
MDDAVLSWLEQSRVSDFDVENDSDWIYFNASLAKAEQMMDAGFFYFAQDANKSQTKRI